MVRSHAWFVPPPEDTEERSGEDKKAHYKRKRAEREAAALAAEQEEYNKEVEELESGDEDAPAEHEGDENERLFKKQKV